MSIIQGNSKSSAAGYNIDQSILFNAADNSTMTRSFGTPTDQNKFTFAFWIKSTKQQGGYNLGINVTGGVTFAGMAFNGNNMAFYDYTGGSANIDIRTTFTSGVGKFRDFSAWYHAMFVYDSDQGTDSDRVKFYINGVQFPAADLVGPLGGSVIWPSSGFNSKFNTSGNTHRISDLVNGKVDGYMAELYFIDGQALDPTSFGEFDADSNQFVPIAYEGTFGNNGFHITGEDSADLGADYSGNSNDFTSSGLTSANQVTDSPTDNYATLNSLNRNSNVTFADGNLEASSGTNGWFGSIGTVGIQLGDKVYFEGKCLTNTRLYFGLSRVNGSGGTIRPESDSTFEGGQSDTDYMWRVTDANTVYYQTTNQSVTVSAVAVNDIVGCSVDTDGTVKFYKNGTEIHSFSTTLVAGDIYMPVYSVNGATSTEKWEVRFGSTGISHQPTGFSLLRTSDMDDPTIADGSEYYHNQTYTGTGSSGLAITNDASAGDFKPDILWLAPRSNGDNHLFFDIVRGTTQRLKSNGADAEDTDGTALITFETDGFDLDTTDPNFNGSGNTYVAWQWKTTGGTSGSNTDGDITSTVSANTTAGFSALTYTGNGSDNQEIGHGLGIAPKMIWTKRRDSTGNWTSYHDAVGINQVFYLNSTALPTSNTEQYRAVPTSSVYTVGVGGDINSSGGTYVAYCFAEVDGFSRISSYTGNGSTDGTFVFTGFKPSWIILKRITGSTQEWQIYDASRDPYNLVNHKLEANSNSAESILTTDNNLDFLSNGFKLLQANGGMNASGSEYLYMAFAECPFKTANARGITTNGA